MAITSKQPKSDEVEVSVFGPGYGEAVLVHLGAGEWVIVDSCWDVRAHRNPILHYLSSIGVDPNAVVAVVVSHWHSDHVRGISDIALACSAADFWISAALTIEWYGDAYPGNEVDVNSGISSQGAKTLETSGDTGLLTTRPLARKFFAENAGWFYVRNILDGLNRMGWQTSSIRPGNVLSSELDSLANKKEIEKRKLSNGSIMFARNGTEASVTLREPEASGSSHDQQEGGDGQ